MTRLSVLPLENEMITELAYSADCKTLAIGCRGGDVTVTIIDRYTLLTWRRIRSINLPTLPDMATEFNVFTGEMKDCTLSDGTVYYTCGT